MRNASFAAAIAALACLAATGATAAENWIGAWGYTAMPLPPGFTAVTVIPPAQVNAIPLGAAVPDQPALVAAPAQPLLDNPGNLPVAAATDLANVTLRQLVRVSAAGKRLRLRISNEGQTLPLVLGAVHVALADADGAIVPGSDHAVTFDGHGGVPFRATRRCCPTRWTCR